MGKYTSKLISGEELLAIRKQEAIVALREWAGTFELIFDGPGIKDLALAILEPKPNGEHRTFPFHFSRRSILFNCWLVSIRGLDSLPYSRCEIEMCCKLDNTHQYRFQASYSFQERKGFVKISHPL